MQAFEGLLPNIDLNGCSRDQLKELFPERFFPCPECDFGDFNSSQQLRQQLTAEQLACIEQGSTAWQYARSRHITGSRLGELLGFNLPQPNRVLVQHQVYHIAADRRKAQQQLRFAVAALRDGDTAAGSQPPALSAYGTLCCAWGCKHEAAALHTLLYYSPQNSLLFDSGFVTLNPATVAAHPQLFSEVFQPTYESQIFGTLGPLDPRQVLQSLRIGCSLDGLLAVPTKATAAAAEAYLAPTTAAAAAAGGVECGLQHDKQQQQQQQQQQQFDGSSIRRAPPYGWLTDAGYQLSVVEVKCPAPYYPVADRPCVFGLRGAANCQPYKCMKAHHYCQAQLSMLVTGVENCIFVVWTRRCSWLLHIPINKPWLHACLHLLMIIHTRYVQQQQTNNQQHHDQAAKAVSSSAAAAAAGDDCRDAHAVAPCAIEQQPVPSSAVPPDNLFWYDPDPSVRHLYRQFILQTARLAAAMRSDNLPDPVSLPRQICSSDRKPAAAAAKQCEASSAPADWTENDSARSPAAAAAAAAAVAAAGGGGSAAAASSSSLLCIPDRSIDIHSCLVRSVNHHWSKQQPLQRGRWFLDRCDPDSPRSVIINHPSQPDHHYYDLDLGDDLRQAWLDHPLLDHLTMQPQAMLLLLKMMHQEQSAAQPAPAAAAAADGIALSPGPVLLAMLLKMEQTTGVQLTHLWQQLPLSAQQLVQDMRSTLLSLTDNTAAVTDGSLGTLKKGGSSAHYDGCDRCVDLCNPKALQGDGVLFRQRYAQEAADSTDAVAAVTEETAACFLGSNPSAVVANGSSSFWVTEPGDSLVGAAAAAAGGGGDGGSLGALWNTRRQVTTAAAAAADRGGSSARVQSSKRLLASRVLTAARSRQQQVALTRYQRAVQQYPMRVLLQWCPYDVQRVQMDQPLHQLLRQALAVQAANYPSSQLCGLPAGAAAAVVARLVDNRRRQYERELHQEQQCDSAAAAATADGGGGSVICNVIDRVRSAPAVLQTGQFVTDGVRMSCKTGRKVFRRQFEGSSTQPAKAAAAAPRLGGPSPVTSHERGVVQDAVTTAAPVLTSLNTQHTEVTRLSQNPPKPCGLTGTSSGRLAVASRAVSSAGKNNNDGTAAARDGTSSSVACRRRSLSWPGAIGHGRRRSPTSVLPPSQISVAAGVQHSTSVQPQVVNRGDLSAAAAAPIPAAAPEAVTAQQYAPGSVMAGEGFIHSSAAAVSVIRTGGVCIEGHHPYTTPHRFSWCNLGRVPASARGPLFSVGAITAAAKQGSDSVTDRDCCDSSFGRLLQSRGALRRHPMVTEQQTDHFSMIRQQAVISDLPGNTALLPTSAVQTDPTTEIIDDHTGIGRHHSLVGSSLGYVPDSLVSRSAEVAAVLCDGQIEAVDSIDAELDELLASGAFDELLNRTKEDWERVDHVYESSEVHL